MPTYEFKCPSCFRLEEQYFSFTDTHALLCPSCKEVPMDKVIQATPAILRGGGWGGM